MFCCQGNVDDSTGASLAGRGVSCGTVPRVAVAAIVSAEIVAGLSTWMAAANGREAALVLRKVRRLLFIVSVHASPEKTRHHLRPHKPTCLVDEPRWDENAGDRHSHPICITTAHYRSRRSIDARPRLKS